MSTIKVNKIENTGTTAGGVEIDSSGHVQIDGQQFPTAGPLSNRNLIVNGACRVNQRQTTPTITGNTFGPVDHFETRCVRDQWQGQLSQETVSVNNEFKACLRVKTTTAETTVDGTNQIVVETHMEGQDIQHLSHGTSDAKPLTLSFWVRSSRPGTYIVKLYRLDGSAGRQLNKTYTINTADTWEYKTFTFVGDTSGNAIPDTTSEGMRVAFQLAAGPDFTSGSQPTTWTTYSNAIWAAGHVENSFMTTVNATWDVTGVQLEVGEKATPFEHRSYGDELTKCHRYFQTFGTGAQFMRGAEGTVYSSASLQSWYPLHTPMRALPTARNSDGTTTVTGQSYDSNYATSQGQHEYTPTYLNTSGTVSVGLNYTAATNSNTNLPTAVKFVGLSDVIHLSAEL